VTRPPGRLRRLGPAAAGRGALVIVLWIIGVVIVIIAAASHTAAIGNT